MSIIIYDIVAYLFVFCIEISGDPNNIHIKGGNFCPGNFPKLSFGFVHAYKIISVTFDFNPSIKPFSLSSSCFKTIVMTLSTLK